MNHLIDESIDQKVLDSLKLQVLEEQRNLLCKCLRPEHHFPFFRSKAVLNLSDCEEIKAEITSRGQASKFLDILSTKGPVAYDTLCRSLLIDETQMHLLESLNRMYEEKKNRYLALVNGRIPGLTDDLRVNPTHLPRPTSSDV